MVDEEVEREVGGARPTGDEEEVMSPQRRSLSNETQMSTRRPLLEVCTDLCSMDIW